VSGEDEVGLADLPADLPALAAAFSLPPISEYRYLTDGWMNRNWVVAAGSGRYVLRRILDVPDATARSVLAAVAQFYSYNTSGQGAGESGFASLDGLHEVV